MKFLIVAVALVAVVVAQQSPEPIPILKQTNEVNPDGSFEYSFEGGNGISVAARGVPGPATDEGSAVHISGHYEYPGENGPIRITYIADDNGYRAEGDSIPVPQPIPEAIARSIEFNAASAASSNARAQREQPKNYGRRF